MINFFRKAIVKIENRKRYKNISISIGDITTYDCDCIVNAANNSLLGGGGVDGAIHKAAGPALLTECRKLNGCKTGDAKITKGYNLPAKFVIHTVGPQYTGTDRNAFELRNCYWNCLKIAKENGIKSIVFPAISTGIYGYPKLEAARIAVNTVRFWLDITKCNDIKIVFCCYEEEDFDIYKNLLFKK